MIPFALHMKQACGIEPRTPCALLYTCSTYDYVPVLPYRPSHCLYQRMPFCSRQSAAAYGSNIPFLHQPHCCCSLYVGSTLCLIRTHIHVVVHLHVLDDMI